VALQNLALRVFDARPAPLIIRPCFRVWGLGLRVCGLWFGVQGSGFRVQGLGLRV